jgi:hypothetical protein
MNQLFLRHFECGLLIHLTCFKDYSASARLNDTLYVHIFYTINFINKVYGCVIIGFYNSQRFSWLDEDELN